MLLRVKLTQRAGDLFAFEGAMNEERTDLTFAKPKGDVFDFVPGGTAAFAMPQDGVHLTVFGNNRVEPPKTRMSKEEMTAWVKTLKDQGYKMSAQDGLRHPPNTEV